MNIGMHSCLGLLAGKAAAAIKVIRAGQCLGKMQSKELFTHTLWTPKNIRMKWLSSLQYPRENLFRDRVSGNAFEKHYTRSQRSTGITKMVAPPTSTFMG